MHHRTFALFAAMPLAVSLIGAPITSPGQLNGTTTTIDFSQFTGGNQHFGSGGPVQIGTLTGVDVKASSATSSLYLYNAGWGLNSNGTWDSGRVGYLGLWPNNGPVRIDFDTAPVSGFGFFMNYIPGYPNSELRAYDSGGTLLETFAVTATAPISTPGGNNAGAFRGIQRAQADIDYIELLGQGGVYDNLQFVSGSSVPEPATTLLILPALAALTAFRKRLLSR